MVIVYIYHGWTDLALLTSSRAFPKYGVPLASLEAESVVPELFFFFRRKEGEKEGPGLQRGKGR